MATSRILSLALALVYACQAQDCLKDQRWPDDPKQAAAQLDTAPIVVVGTIISEREVGPAKPSAWSSRMRVRLQQLKINVENVLRGDVQLGEQEFYAFYTATSYDGPPPLGSWQYQASGKRKLFYLRRNCGVIRTVCDVKNSCVVPVNSGRHPSSIDDRKGPLERAIAQILFTRGIDITREQFLDGLESSAKFVPITYAKPHLLRLSQSGDARERDVACVLMRDIYVLRTNALPPGCAERPKQTQGPTKESCAVWLSAGVPLKDLPKECK
jgi:hypothetical protein